MSHVPLLGVWNPEMGFLGEIQERAYNLNDNFSRGLNDTLIHKKELIFAIRGHFQLLEVN